MRNARSQVRSKKALVKAADAQLVKRLRIGLAISVITALVAGGLGYWDRLVGGAPDKRVNVYRVHGCRCVFEWARTLERDGYVVHVREYETLKYVRQTLHVPQHLQGCHVAEYLGYFIEGHVSGAQLQRLNAERPAALGLAASVDAEADQRVGAVDLRTNGVLVDLAGRSGIWQARGADQ